MRNLSWAGALVLALLLGAATSLFVRVGAVDDLASRLEEALIEGEKGRLATCQQALPDHRRLWPLCVKKLELDFDILAGCFRLMNRLDASRQVEGKTPDPSGPFLFQRDQRIEDCREEAWQQVISVVPDWLAISADAEPSP